MTALRLVVVGTGTEIGKTHFGVALVRALSLRGERVVGLKPVESGVDLSTLRGADGEALDRHSTFHVKHPPPYLFAEPISPHLAARRVGKNIDLRVVSAWVDDIERTLSDTSPIGSLSKRPCLIVETAGGLFSPLGPTLTNLDLCLALHPRLVVLVAPDRLGVLHDVTACVLAARSRSPGFTPFVVLQAPATPDASTGTNLAELLSLGLIERGVSLPRTLPTEPAYQEALLPLVDNVSRETIP